MTSPNPQPSRLLSYLRLLRFPNVFTAFADIAMGFCFVRDSFQPAAPFLFLLCASGCLYLAGMVLNDVYDLEIDRVERPRRPLPSGQIDVAWAKQFGFGLLLLGVVVAAIAGYLPSPEPAKLPWRSAAVAAALALCVILYDLVLKSTAIGPLVMGACRFFNVLLGMSLAAQFSGDQNLFLGYDAAQFLVAGGIATYIAGVTWFARSEATVSQRASLVLAVTVMAIGFVLLAYFPQYGEHAARLRLKADLTWPLMLLLLGVTIFRRAIAAIVNPKPEVVQAAIKHCILSLIFLDAAIALVIRGPETALAILALVVPMFLLGRWVYST